MNEPDRPSTSPARGSFIDFQCRMPNARTMIHFSLIGVMVWLSAAFYLSENIFTSSNFAEFKLLGTEHQWSRWLAVVAIYGIVGILSGRRFIMLTCAFVLATAHGLLAYCFYLSYLPTVGFPTGVGTYGLFAVQGYYLFFRRLLA